MGDWGAAAVLLAAVSVAACLEPTLGGSGATVLRIYGRDHPHAFDVAGNLSVTHLLGGQGAPAVLAEATRVRLETTRGPDSGPHALRFVAWASEYGGTPARLFELVPEGPRWMGEAVARPALVDLQLVVAIQTSETDGMGVVLGVASLSCELDCSEASRPIRGAASLSSRSGLLRVEPTEPGLRLTLQVGNFSQHWCELRPATRNITNYDTDCFNSLRAFRFCGWVHPLDAAGLPPRRAGCWDRSGGIGENDWTEPLREFRVLVTLENPFGEPFTPSPYEAMNQTRRADEPTDMCGFAPCTL